MCFQSENTPETPFKGRNINHTIRVDPEMATSAQLFERDVLRGPSGIGFVELRALNLSKLCNNLQFNNLEIAKFQLIFATNGLKNS